MPHEMFVVKLSKSFILLCLPNSITLNTTFPAKIFDKQPLKKVLTKSVHLLSWWHQFFWENACSQEEGCQILGLFKSIDSGRKLLDLVSCTLFLEVSEY